MRKFLLIYLPLFGLLAFIGLTPGNLLMLLVASPLLALAIPYISVAAPTILLCLVALISLGVASAPQPKRSSRIAAAILFAIVSMAVIAIGPGMLGRREATELTQRIVKDDIRRAAASLPIATDRSPPR
jgi:hypothetical protein